MVDAEIQANGNGDINYVGTPERRAEIIAFVRRVSSMLHEIDDRTQRVSCILSEEDYVIRSGLNYVATIKEVVDDMLRFLESPLGQRTTELLWRHIDGIRHLADVGAGIFISSLFVVVAQELLLDVKEDEFNLARNRIEMCIKFVQNKLPDIQSRIGDAADLLKLVREYPITATDENSSKTTGNGENRELERILWNFQDTVRHAKLDIDDCDSHLEDADKQIEIAMSKIKAKMWLNGAWRGALLGCGALVIYTSVKDRLLPLLFSIGVCLSCASFLVRVPHYRKLENDFLEYKDTHDNLHIQLKLLQRRLENHERAFNN